MKIYKIDAPVYAHTRAHTNIGGNTNIVRKTSISNTDKF